MATSLLRVLLWDTLCALVGISTCTPYCSTQGSTRCVHVCLTNSKGLTH